MLMPSSPLSLALIKLLKRLIGRAGKFLIGRKGMGQLGRATKQFRELLDGAKA